MQAETIKILIVEDKVIIRHGMVDLISPAIGLDVLGQAAYGIDALALLRTQKFDIALIDMVLPDMSGLEVVKTAIKEDIQTKFIVCTSYVDEDFMLDCAYSGINGYLPKELVPEFVISIIREVAQGKYVYPILGRNEFIIAESYDNLKESILLVMIERLAPLNRYLQNIPLDQNKVIVQLKDLQEMIGRKYSTTALYLGLDAGWKVKKFDEEKQQRHFVRKRSNK